MKGCAMFILRSFFKINFYSFLGLRTVLNDVFLVQTQGSVFSILSPIRLRQEYIRLIAVLCFEGGSKDFFKKLRTT